MIGRPSPTASARDAKLWLITRMRAPSGPAFARMLYQAVSMSAMSLPGFTPGTTHGLSGSRCMVASKFTPEGKRCTIRRPVLPLTMRISAL